MERLVGQESQYQAYGTSRQLGGPDEQVSQSPMNIDNTIEAFELFATKNDHSNRGTSMRKFSGGSMSPCTEQADKVLRLRGGAAEQENTSDKQGLDASSPSKGNEQAPGAGQEENDSQSSRPGAIGNHPSPAEGLRAPMFRVGFAGRHAVRGGPSRSQVQEQTQQGEPPAADGGGRGRGGATFRIGFAGRGASSGPARGGHQFEPPAAKGSEK